MERFSTVKILKFDFTPFISELLISLIEHEIFTSPFHTYLANLVNTLGDYANFCLPLSLILDSKTCI